MDRKQYIESLIEEAQKNIWRNELALGFKLKFPDQSTLTEDAVKHNIKKDNEYIEFLKENI
jgi:hypothetical protein